MDPDFALNEYKIKIDSTVMEIFDNKIKLNHESIHILKDFVFFINNSRMHDHQLEIFKFTGEIFDNECEYDTFWVIKYHIIPYRKCVRVPKFIIIEITKWLFK